VNWLEKIADDPEEYVICPECGAMHDWSRLVDDGRCHNCGAALKEDKE
jgi:uncharacterized C2H2 Zn-finger protein